ncbi:HK97 family phage prohead protease [Gemmata sp. G18]|uniref:HK97 family phage prohead protease n=1 Tax=Gemmata palustris TaxID=2822762 RepID=A0ABS5C0L0_9BACT|nr:HK97 family phage prohead protease [Gemmata palustris]MBP3959448.1 HK97 family phage prohead protease [Gemmata palustris]
MLTIPESGDNTRTSSDPNALDTAAVAKRLNCHVITIRRLVAAGRFPQPFGVGSRPRWRAADIDRWIERGGSTGPKIEYRSGSIGGERRHANRRPTVRTEGGNRVLSGYGAVFHVPGDPGTEYELNTDLWERINPDAFTRTLRERPDVVCCQDHDTARLLGRTTSGTLRLTVDKVGLRYEVDLPNTPTGNEVYELARRGDLNGSSFSFFPHDSKRYADDGRDIIERMDLELYELGPVSIPAYTGSTAGVAADAGGRSNHGTDARADQDAVAVQLALMGMEDEEREVSRPVPPSPRARKMNALSAQCRRIASECDRERIAATLRLTGSRGKPSEPQMVCEFCGRDELEDCMC